MRALAKHKNVIITGPPAVGKSHIMSSVITNFKQAALPARRIAPAADVPIPRGNRGVPQWLPSPGKRNRNAFQITFHQGTKHRDFISGIAPNLGSKAVGFSVVSGTLFNANLHALQHDSTSLVCIDEINRGPAVAIFGDTLTSIEPTKRLGDDGSPTEFSVPFTAYSPSTNSQDTLFLSSDVYILASMNEADTSVEPLDVAFLRRFFIYRIGLDKPELVRYFNLQSSNQEESQADAADITTIYQLLVDAWQQVNEKIAIGKSSAFQIGHGVLMNGAPPQDYDQALTYAVDCWKRIESHVLEVFFGNEPAIAAVLNAKPGGVYELVEREFAEQEVFRLAIKPWGKEHITDLLLQVSGRQNANDNS